MSQSTWPRVKLSDGAVEAMKWLGLILMTADHAQKYGLMLAVPGVYEAGRVAFPLFGIVLATTSLVAGVTIPLCTSES